MSPRQALKLDLNNLFKPAIGDGIDAISTLDKFFTECHPAIKALKKTGQMPFCRQPLDTAMFDAVMVAAKSYRDYDNIIILGVGGSSLGAASLAAALTTVTSKQTLHAVDFIDAASLAVFCGQIQNKKNLFVLISKSGNTTETLAQYLFFKKQLNLKPKDFFVITDVASGFLHDLAVKEKIKSLDVPVGVGGRFSVFTPVALFPLAACGVDIQALLEGARVAQHHCDHDVFVQNPAALLATALFFWIDQIKISQLVIMPYANRLRLFNDWFAQLWAESLGKRYTVDGKEVYTGITPIKALGVADQHSQLQLYLEGPRDKVVLFVTTREDAVAGVLDGEKTGDDRIDFLLGKSLSRLAAAEYSATEESLREAGRPSAALTLSHIDEFQLGQLYQTIMNVIPYLGILLNINAFDQPAVERIKRFTYGLMGRSGFDDYAQKMKNFEKQQGLIF